jgi:lysophospholipid acyltransferase
LSYNGADPSKHQWDRIVCIYIYALETSASTAEILKLWNHQVHQWLKHYVQARVLTKGVKPGMKENMSVFAVSAFWHGFYPFYYVMFFFAAINLELCKDIYKSRILFRWMPPMARHLIANFLTMGAMNYFAISFCQLTFERGGNFAKNTYYSVFLAMVVGLFITRTTGLVKIA